jgi:hypothetical protein
VWNNGKSWHLHRDKRYLVEHGPQGATMSSVNWRTVMTSSSFCIVAVYWLRQKFLLIHILHCQNNWLPASPSPASIIKYS